MNFYKQHIGDYIASTAHLSWLEDAAYRRMMDAYYLRERPLPVNEVEVCRLVRCTSAAEKAAVKTILLEFFDLRDDGWHQKRCDEEVWQYQMQAGTNKRIAVEREARKTANEASTNRARTVEPVVHARSEKNDAEREPNQEPRTSNQRKAKPPTPLPEWLSPEVWARWRSERSARKKSMTPVAELLAIQALNDLRRQGHDPTAVIDQSIANGWTGLFAVKARDSPINGSGKFEERKRVMDEIYGRNQSTERVIDGTAERVD